MAKNKTHKGIAKRFKITAKGKVRYKRSFAGHLMSSKNGKRRRQLRTPSFIEGAPADKIKRALLS